MKIGKPVRACAFATAVNTLRSSSVRTPPCWPISPNAPSRCDFASATSCVGDLIGALGRDVRRIIALHVEPAAADDVHARCRGDPFQRAEIAIHIRMSAVDDAADAVGGGRLRFVDHQIDVIAETGRHRTPLLLRERFRERIADGQVLVEQHRTVDAIR